MAIDSDKTPAGPMWVGGHLTTLTRDEAGRDYSLLWLPDKNNKALREAGEPMVFYYLLDRSRLAEDADGHYKFHLQKFSGVMDPDKNIGAPGYAEIAGGYLNFTTTMKIPEPVIETAKEKFKEKVRNQFGNHPLLRLVDIDVEPNFRPIPVVDSRTKLHTVSKRDGSGSGGSGEGGGGEGEAEGGASGASGRSGDENVPPWGWDVQGTGKGSLNPVGTNAFSAMLGQFPVQLLEGAAKSGESNLTVENHLTYNIWAPVVSIEIDGNWKSVYQHFSAAFSGDAWVTQADVEAEMNNLEKKGDLTIEVDYNEEFVSEEEMKKYQDAADSMAEKFMTIAQGAILEKKKPDVEAASANTGDSWFPQRQFSVKARFDRSKLSLEYEKNVQKMVTRKSVQRTSLTGVFDEIQENEEAKQRYFSEVYLDEAFQKVHVIASSNANWGGEDTEGDPINKLMMQVGYPDSEGNLVWKSSARYRESEADTELSQDGVLSSWTENTQDRIYVFDFTKHDDLENPDEISVQEIISFDEHPQVLVDEVTEERTTNQHVLEVRAETPGHLSVGPITIDQPIPNDQVSVLVTLRADGVEDETVKFAKGNESPKHWDIWYEDDATDRPYEYQVEAVVSPNTFGMESLRWSSGWQSEQGSGPLVAEIPPVPDDRQETLQNYLG